MYYRVSRKYVPLWVGYLEPPGRPGVYSPVMRNIWMWSKRVVAILFLGLLASNVLLPAVARAQFAAQNGVTTLEIIAALVGQTITAERYVATASSGTAYDTTSVLSCAVDLGPGANNCLGTDASGRNIIGAGAGTAEVWIGDSGTLTMTENGNVTNTNGAYNCRANCFLVNDFGTDPLRITDANGVTINATTAVKGILLVPVTIDVGSITQSTCDDVLATVAGVEANDTIFVTPNFDLTVTDVIIGNARVTNAGTDEVTFRACNVDAAAPQDPASGSYLFFVIR